MKIHMFTLLFAVACSGGKSDDSGLSDTSNVDTNDTEDVSDTAGPSDTADTQDTGDNGTPNWTSMSAGDLIELRFKQSMFWVMMQMAMAIRTVFLLTNLASGWGFTILQAWTWWKASLYEMMVLTNKQFHHLPSVIIDEGGGVSFMSMGILQQTVE